MSVSSNTRRILIFVLLLIILEGDTKRPNLKEGILPLKRDYRPSKWVANSAMDVWYGNKSMIDVISREFADIMYKLTARPVRSTHLLRSNKRRYEKKTTPAPKEKTKEETSALHISRVEINFINRNNETVHTIRLQPLKPSQNSTVFRVLEPLLGNPDYF